MGAGRLVVGLSLASILACFPVFAVAADEPVDAVLFVDHCAPCHGHDARGKTPIGRARRIPDLTADAVRERLDADYIAKLVREGRTDATTGKERMPSFSNRLTDDQIKMVAGYVMNLGE
ncbi:MAG TPA: c-type cytochrome [Candidatus Binatia bacterium]|nr:c-type cytochrome [Candidatus Binatia bacterium]